MNSITSFIQRTAAALSARALCAMTPWTAAAVPAFAGANFAAGFRNRAGNADLQPMHALWLGGTAETGCVKTTYVTKRISTGHLDEVST